MNITAPTELVSVERMTFHFLRPILANHGLHRDELGGGLENLCVARKFERFAMQVGAEHFIVFRYSNRTLVADDLLPRSR